MPEERGGEEGNITPRHTWNNILGDTLKSELVIQVTSSIQHDIYWQ